MNPGIVALDNVSRKYPADSRDGHSDGYVHALREVTLTVQTGERVAITGRSGAGKSTLFHILAMLDTGFTGTYLRYLANGEGSSPKPLERNDFDDHRHHVLGFVHQELKLLPHLSALDNVGMPLLFEVPRRQREERARGILEALGIDKPKQRRRPAELSRGEKQRVAIARAFVREPPLLLLDEPTASLGSWEAALLFDLLREQVDGKKQAVYVVTHEPELFNENGFEIRCIDNGRIAQ